jgi:hypothetical protein
MAGTPVSEVYDLFLQAITDYRLMVLFNTSTTDFENFLEAWLEFSITDFDICNQDLTFDHTTKVFSVALTQLNKNILASLMVKYWMQKNVNDITQINLHVGDKDFKIASEANNLKEKIAQLNVQKEECSQLLISYAYRANDWTSWFNQSFAGS